MLYQDQSQLVISPASRLIDMRKAPISSIRIRGDIISPFIIYRNWVDEMLMKMFGVFKNVALHGARNGDVINQTV